MSRTGIITPYLTLRYVVRSGFLDIYPDCDEPAWVCWEKFRNISNEVGRVKSVSLFFYFFRTHLYSCAVPLLSLTGDAPQFSGCSSCPTYGLGSCHFIVSVLSTRHLSDHVRP